MKIFIFIFIFIFVACEETQQKEQPIDTEVTVQNIPQRIEDSALKSFSLEKNTNKRYTQKELSQLVGNMFIVGFYGTKVNQNSQIINDIERYHLGGVILFDKHPSKKGKSKNIQNPKQLRQLTQTLQSSSPYPLLIAIDQEGGKVARLKKKNGFQQNYPSAKEVSKNHTTTDTQKIYTTMGKELSKLGINLNFAPVVDMEINPKNVVIVKLKRSYGKTSERVTLFSKIFIESMHKYKILTSLKHFPGHGSSTGDSHKGFVDVSKSWKSKELEPYKNLIDENLVDTIMVAHVFNKRLDPLYPASLSQKTINQKLRKEMRYKGVVVTDDLQMYAISKHYSLKETIKLTINAGADLLLFGNQLDPKNIVSVRKLVDTTMELIKDGDIDIKLIEKANIRIHALTQKL